MSCSRHRRCRSTAPTGTTSTSRRSRCLSRGPGASSPSSFALTPPTSSRRSTSSSREGVERDAPDSSLRSWCAPLLMIGALVWYSRRKKKRSKAWPAVEGRNPETNAGPNPSDLVRGQLFRSQLLRGRRGRWRRRRFLRRWRCRGRRFGRGRLARRWNLAYRPHLGFPDLDPGDGMDRLASLGDRLRKVAADDSFDELADRLLRRDVGHEL